MALNGMNKTITSLGGSDLPSFLKQLELQEYLKKQTGLADVSIFLDPTVATADSTISMSNLAEADLSEEGIEKASKNAETKSERGLFQMLKSLFSNEDLKSKVDMNGDGKIDDTEMRDFLSEIKGLDGNADSLSLSDFSSALSRMGIDLKGNQDDAEQSTVAKKTNPTSNASRAGSSGRIGGGGSSGVSSGGRSAGPGASSSVSKAETLEGLQEQKTQLETEISQTQEEISKISDGTSDKVSGAKDDMEKAKEEMDKAIKEDPNLDEEIKKEFTEITDEIQKNDEEISKNDAAIIQNDSQISQTENSITNLENALNSLAQPSGKEGDKEKDAKIEARKSELTSQINEKKQELETLKNEKQELETQKTQLQTKKEELETKKSEIEKKITDNEDSSKNCSGTTDKMIQNYNTKKQEFEKLKETELSAAKSVLDSKVKELNEVEVKINEKQNKEAEGPTFNFEDGEFSEEEMAAFEANWEANKDRYEKVAEKTGIPAELIAAIHWREGSGNFDTYLHNGEPLGQVTTLVPAGIYFDNWEEAAIDAMNSHRNGSPLTADSTDLDAMAEFAEQYNGLGYRNRGIPSAYVWAGTDQYTSGKFVADGVFDPNAVDQQLGVMLMLKHIM